MQALKQRWNYIFRSAKGLAMVNIALISLAAARTLTGIICESGHATPLARGITVRRSVSAVREMNKKLYSDLMDSKNLLA